MAHWNQLMLQDASSPIMEMLISFHDLVIMMMVMIMSLVSFFILSLMKNKYLYRMGKHAHKIEFVWTVIPGFVLLVLAIPSLYLLYTMEELNNPSITIKCVGHQWYWNYQYSDFPHLNYDSYMIKEDNLNMGNYRLLEVDNRLVLPVNSEIRVLVTSMDVIHSWTVPTLGIKVDAIPGRLNQLSLFSNYIGVFFGQCSEICGMNHSFMPIGLEIISEKKFLAWAKP